MEAEDTQLPIVNRQLSFPGPRTLAAGAVGGICSVTVGYPFDLIKVRMQAAKSEVRASALQMVKRSVAGEGLRRVGVITMVTRDNS